MLAAKQCKQLGDMGNVGSLLPGDLLDLCDCLDMDESVNSDKCKCNDVLNNEELKAAFQKFKNCFGSNTESNTGSNTESNKESNMGILTGLLKGVTEGLPGNFASLFPGGLNSMVPGELNSMFPGGLDSIFPGNIPGNFTNPVPQRLSTVSHEGSNTEPKVKLNTEMPKNNLKFLTGNCYISSLKDILSSLKGNTICSVNISSYKEKGEKIIEYLEVIEDAAVSTLKHVKLINSGIILGENLFSRVITRFSSYNIALPLFVSGSIVVIIIGILYMINKSIPPSFFDSRRNNDVQNNDEQNYDEQMKILQEQYNETLRTTAMLNQFLLGYQPN
ncbi:PIR protein [Plasmodium ovale]|nr:PIR protein [Plasmodium ovale]